ncbi:hypothetical protein [Rufibacter soli]
MKNRKLIVILFSIAALLAFASLALTFYLTGRIEWLRLVTFLFSGILAYVIYTRK